MQKISIFGCGWLGFPLAKKLVANGFSVKGSTTTYEKLAQLENEGIRAFELALTENSVSGNTAGFLEGSEILMINIPPGLRRKPKSDFMQKMRLFMEVVEKSAVEKVLFVSSTSVFEDAEDFPVYTENDIPNREKENAQQLAGVEKMLLENSAFTTTILRFGGLCGEDRHPVRFLSGRENVSNPEGPINLIDQKDCIALIEKIISTKSWGKVFHGVYPNHSSKENYYAKTAQERSLKPPRFSTKNKSKGKIISSAKTHGILDFTFQFKP